jgi:peptidyl-prolyl cis-trans isomerase D
VFQMQPGAISDLIESPFGFHIIKLEAIQPEVIRSFEAVKNELATTIKNEKAKTYAFQQASTAYEGIIRAGNLKKYGKTSSQPIHETDYFPRNSPPKDISSDPKFFESLSRLKKGELSPLIELNNGYAILFVEDIQQAAIPQLNEIKDMVTADYRKANAVELARKEAEALLKAAGKDTTLSEAAKKLHMETKQSPFLKRSLSGDSDILPPQVVQEAFHLPWKKSLPEKVSSVGPTYYVYQVTDRHMNEPQLDEATRRQLGEQLLISEQNQTVTNWLTSMEKNSDIWTNNQALE